MASEQNNNDVVDLIAADLVPGQMDELRRLFNTHGAPSPIVLFSPQPADLQTSLMRRFAEVCETFVDDGGIARTAAFSIDALGPLATWAMVVVPDGDEYLYAYYGSGIAEHYGRDMTGQTSAEFTDHIAQFFKAVYRAATERRERVLTEHEPPSRVFVRSWRRLIVPLFADDGETVDRFVVANLPDNELRAGLELIVDPVFVLDAQQRIQFANRAAQRMFDFDVLQSQGTELRTLTDVDLDLPHSPDHMLAHQIVDDSLQLSLRGGIAERLVVTASAAEHRGRAYYIVVMRQLGA